MFFRKIKIILPLFVLLILGLLFWKGLQNDPHKLPSPLLDKALPYFKLPALMSETLITPDDLKGHIALVNVFATWCLTCHEEHPVLMDIAASREVLIYGINYKDNPEKARNWLSTYGNPYQKIIVDQKGNLAIDLGVYGTPETFIIDSSGMIRYKYTGAISPRVWETILKPKVKQLKLEKS